MATTYKVKKGDTLSEIAVTYKNVIGSSLTLNQRIQRLVDLNDIENRELIYIGQVLKLDGTIPTKKKSTSYKPTVNAFGLQSNTDRTVFATWKFDHDHVDHYKIMWKYATGDGIWFIGNETTDTHRQSTYTAPQNAVSVRFTVLPVATKRTVNKKKEPWWTGKVSTEKIYKFSNNPPTTPPVPTVEIDNNEITLTINNLDYDTYLAKQIEFDIVRDDAKSVERHKVAITKNAVSWSTDITVGHRYKVRARSIRGDLESDWSEYSNNNDTIPTAPSGWKKYKATSSTSVSLDWINVSNCEKYEVQYTTKKAYFDSNPSEVKSVTVESVVGHAEITGMESGETYFFRVRAINSVGESGWSSIVSIVVGKEPAAPTTWSSTTTATVGESLYLYWVHNSEDGSSQTYAELELIVDGTKTTETIKNSTDEDLKDKTSVKTISTKSYKEGAKIQWRVRTKGVLDKYGPWSVQRTVDIYAKPTLELTVKDGDNLTDGIRSFPVYIEAESFPYNQTPTGYHVKVTTKETTITVDEYGNESTIKAGAEVYSAYFDSSDHNLRVQLKPSDVDFTNNITYKFTVTVSMNSGLTKRASTELRVTWKDEDYEPNASVSINKNKLTAYIRPICEDADGNVIDTVLLSVYRREFDGKFTEIGKNKVNTGSFYVTDPHPSLDMARYRIVATSTVTGAISFSDIPGVPVGETSVVIQWKEEWYEFDTTSEDELAQPDWSGSRIKIPYNIDISESNSPDVSMVKYIGREHPVSYYGTQLGSTATWNVEIPADDADTLYALRRLAVWMGNVYVREPSGSGYWANVQVSFSKKHCEETIPVTFKITRVEGGK